MFFREVWKDWAPTSSACRGVQGRSSPVYEQSASSIGVWEDCINGGRGGVRRPPPNQPSQTPGIQTGGPTRAKCSSCIWAWRYPASAHGTQTFHTRASGPKLKFGERKIKSRNAQPNLCNALKKNCATQNQICDAKLNLCNAKPNLCKRALGFVFF